MKIILQLLIALLIGGCANPHLTAAYDTSEKQVIVSHSVSVIFEDTNEYRTYIRNMIAVEIDRFPQINHHIVSVTVETDDKPYSGRYIRSTKTVLLINDDLFAMKKTLWHELCHAMQDLMSEDEIHDWCEVAALRMEEAKIDDWKGDKWRNATYESFPNSYATKDIWEFMSVHFEYFMSNQNYKERFPQEYDLIIKMGWTPKNGHLSSDFPVPSHRY